MNVKTTAVAAVLAAVLGAGASAAQAQQAAATQQAQATVAQPSAKALKPIQELKAAVDAKDLANIPAKLAAARAAAQTPDDRYWVAALEYEAAVASNDVPARAQALEALLATGKVTPSDQANFTVELGKAYFNTNQLDRAAAALERAQTLGANTTDATLLLAETRKRQNRVPDAVALLRKSIEASTANGQKAPEQLYKHAVQMAYDAKLPAAPQIAREWVQAYPTPENWRNALRVYRQIAKVGEDDLIDVLRLHRATGSLSAEADYQQYGVWGVMKGFPGEAKAVLDEGFVAKHINRSTPAFRDIYAAVSSQAAGDRASLDASASKARASGTARQALAAGDAYYGYGEYAKAAELYRVALGKAGADASLVNLRLGMALARAGDKAGATAALNAVTGARAELAKFWLAYLGTRA